MFAQSITQVLVQADYMSGDRYAVASALKLDASVGVIVLTAEFHVPPALATRRAAAKDEEARQKELKEAEKKWYQAATEMQALYGATRCEIVRVKWPATPAPDAARDAVRLLYQQVKQYSDAISAWARGPKTTPAPKRPAFAVALVHEKNRAKFRLYAVTRGTQIIADQYSADSSQALKLLREQWRLYDPKTVSDVRARLETFVRGRGFQPHRRYAILFAKQGDRHAEKAHHFTSILNWWRLQEHLEHEGTIVPVAAGDRIGLRTRPTLAEFWKDPDWKKVVDGLTLDERRAQLGLWCYLAEFYPGMSIIGMRSGMIEVPALLGIRTLYLEEKFNQQAARMEKWIGAVRSGGINRYERLKLERPLGLTQQQYWQRTAGHRGTPTEQNHVAKETRHLTPFVTGVQADSLSPASKKVVKKDPVTAAADPVTPKQQNAVRAERENARALIVEAQKRQLRLVNAVFRGVPAGRSGPAKPAFSTQPFYMRDSEWKWLLAWIGNTPAGTTRVTPPTAAPRTDSAVRVETVDQLTSKTGHKTFTAYFKSAAYVKELDSRCAAVKDADLTKDEVMALLNVTELSDTVYRQLIEGDAPH